MRIVRLLLILSIAVQIANAGEPAKKDIALTFDDLPLAGESAQSSAALEVNQHILAALHKHRAVAIGFVNSKNVDDGDREKRIAVLELWLKSGQMLGNHTYSHPDFNNLSLEQFIADAERGESLLNPMLRTHKQALLYFRYPFNHAGNENSKKEGFQKWLAEHNYRVATCTVENADYLFNGPYLAALASGNNANAAKIRSAYLDFTDAMLHYYEGVSKDLAGRQFAQVFLAHANRLNADSLDEMLSRMEKQGYRFVSIDEAQSDPIYRTADNYVGKFGPMWAYRWAPVLGKKINARSEPEVPKWITDPTGADH